MVYLHFPSKHTEEEIFLKHKYSKLKRKKKALQVHKTPKQEPERTTPVKKKPSYEARGNRELAKKLIRSGAISAIKKPPEKRELSGFKRPNSFGKKPEKIVSGYQPFAGNIDETLPAKKEKLYQGNTRKFDLDDVDHEPDRKKNQTLVVKSLSKGYLSESSIKKSFSKFGEIDDVTIKEKETHITFKNQDSVKASMALNNTKINDCKISVENRSGDKPALWESPASTKSEERDLVSYEDEYFF